jgi:hypothetical protein
LNLVLTHFPMGSPDAHSAEFYRGQFLELSDYASGWEVSFNMEKLQRLYNSYW